MTPLRTSFAIALAAVLLLPYASPVLCTALDREMTMAEAGMGAAVEDDQTADRCDALDCAIAAVAPVATGSLVLAVQPLDGQDVSGAPLQPHDNTVPPLTHPPRA